MPVLRRALPVGVILLLLAAVVADAYDRIARAAIISTDGASVISDLSARGTSLVLHSRPTSPGQRIVAADLVPRSARQTPAAFLSYLRLEGAPDAAARIDRRPLSGIIAAAGRAPRDSAEKVVPDLHLAADANGVVLLPITMTGLWNVRAIHVLTGPTTDKKAGRAPWCRVFADKQREVSPIVTARGWA